MNAVWGRPQTTTSSHSELREEFSNVEIKARAAISSQGHQPPEDNGLNQREDEFSSLWWEEYADCSPGSLAQVVPKNKSNKQLTETHLETFVSSTLYDVEEERVGVPVKGGLNEVASFFAVY
ncbi:unnamed protein product [Eruca vesicaria subsp. sativa]|uniref:Uncharacterized protein n=1 Tax=Eruca vesicaria subsp. sativa TaxID=29727 RepID=A0ABC8IZ33_ERUVS|nr:unnamed protein product [Eruca vesicaria subsp. sativa]